MESVNAAVTSSLNCAENFAAVFCSRSRSIGGGRSAECRARSHRRHRPECQWHQCTTAECCDIRHGRSCCGRTSQCSKYPACGQRSLSCCLRQRYCSIIFAGEVHSTARKASRCLRRSALSAVAPRREFSNWPRLTLQRSRRLQRGFNDRNPVKSFRAT